MLRDAFRDAFAPDVSRVEVPALLCGSFSDHELHSSGTFDAFRRLGSKEKWLYTHGGGKWATYYSEEALAFQARFFDCLLKGEDNGMRQVPSVRLEIHAVRGERAWPIPGTRWTKLHLHGDGALREAPAAATHLCLRRPAQDRRPGPDPAAGILPRRRGRFSPRSLLLSRRPHPRPPAMKTGP